MRKIKASKIENAFNQLSERGFQWSISDKFLLFKNPPFHIFQQILINIILHAPHCVLSNFLYLLVIVYQKIRSNPAATRGKSPSYLYFYQPDQIWLASISKIITERELITFMVLGLVSPLYVLNGILIFFYTSLAAGRRRRKLTVQLQRLMI